MFGGSYLDSEFGTLDVGDEWYGVLDGQSPSDVTLGDGGRGAVKPHGEVDHQTDLTLTQVVGNVLE